MAAQTQSQIIATLANRFGRYATGTVASGSTTTAVAPTWLYHPDNTWVGHYLYGISGNNAAVERLITSFAQTTGTITVSPALALTTAAAVVEIKGLPHQDFTDAIAVAVRAAGTTWVSIVYDTTTVDFSGIGEYALPAAGVDVLGLWSIKGAEKFPVQGYEVVGPVGTKKILVHDYALALATGDLVVQYTSVPTVPTTGAGTLGLDDAVERQCLDFVYEYSLYYLHQIATGRAMTGEAAKTHLALCQLHFQVAMAIKAAANPQSPNIRIAPPQGQMTQQ